MATNWRIGNTNGTKPDDPRDAYKHLGKDIVDGCDAAIDRALNKTQAMRDAETTFGSPGAPGIEIRREGFLFRHDNPEDRKRYEVQRTNRDRQILTARHVKDVGAYIANGQQFIVNVAGHLRETINELPEDMQSLGVSLTNAGLQILSETYIEGAKFNAEMGLREITQATMPGQEQQQ